MTARSIALALVATMSAVEKKLWVKTEVGGVARYENDYYHRISNDIAAVPRNPWFICTLWLADYFITRATNAAELKLALPIWLAERVGAFGKDASIAASASVRSEASLPK